jgi:SRSO17 transposase
MERMAESVPDTNDQSYQHFLSKSPWDEDQVTEQTAHDADDLIGGDKDTCLLIDESGFPKKGNKSAGVSRQYCGELGKVENCQVGVFAVLACRDIYIPIDYRLYIQKSWVKDKERCLSAGIPEEFIEYKRKQDLALQMVIMAQARGVRYGWIGCDAFYGKDSKFLRFLNDMNEIFMADVNKNQPIYLEDPRPYIPAPEATRGRKPTRFKSKASSIRVDQFVKQQPRKAWQKKTIRDTTKGKLKVKVLHHRIWVWDGKETKAHLWHLIIRKDIGTDEIKYSLSNAAPNTPLKRLLFMQGQRYLVERVFEDGKNQCGMGDYQARGWRSWHHHMAMVSMAMLFMAEQRVKNNEDFPLLSSTDVVEILSYYLPNRKATEEEVFRQLEVRHKRRKSAIESAYRKQGP